MRKLAYSTSAISRSAARLGLVHVGGDQHLRAHAATAVAAGRAAPRELAQRVTAAAPRAGCAAARSVCQTAKPSAHDVARVRVAARGAARRARRLARRGLEIAEGAGADRGAQRRAEAVAACSLGDGQTSQSSDVGEDLREGGAARESARDDDVRGSRAERRGDLLRVGAQREGGALDGTRARAARGARGRRRRRSAPA